ncbi:MAG: HAMP domain-containing sensor histidine kinase [Chloroflexota bacterium]
MRHPSAMHNRGQSPAVCAPPAHRRRPPLFALMLAAFALVIVLGVGGMVGLFFLAQGQVGPPAGMIENLTDPSGFPLKIAADGTGHWSRTDVWRGALSASLALAAVLLGLATIFSRRISKPISKLTAAARTMAAGDLSVRVASYGVREINDLADAFNSMAGSISAADGQRRQLTADVAHELRTPLSIIKGRLEGMQDGVYPATPEQIALLLDETALLERLIEDLRLLAQADAGQLPLYLEQVCIDGLLDAVARSFGPQALAAGVAIQIVPPGPLPEVSADSQRISQVLGNLLANAIRHTPAGGTVTLRAWVDPTAPGQVNVAVQDTGAGIAPDDLPNIFERFWKADRARSRSGGAGLGLAIARRIVEAHGGRIWATSALGQGTTVGFTLQPAARN